MIQGYQFSEADYRGTQFADWPCDVKGNNDLLTLTQPDTIKDIHLAYLRAGADVIETNTFNANSPPWRIIRWKAGSRRSTMKVHDSRGKPPTKSRKSKTVRVLSLECWAQPIAPPASAPMSTIPAFAAFTLTNWLRPISGNPRPDSRGRGCHFGETIFDTLNCKAALYAIDVVSEEIGRPIDIMISAPSPTAVAGRCRAKPSRPSSILSVMPIRLASA